VTAREFLEWAGYQINEHTLFALTQYLASDIDFAQFPDASVGDLAEMIDEPAEFEEYMRAE
jgi:hypothetical protein